MGAYELYVKIMPLGDSNTRGWGGNHYRDDLKAFLEGDGWDIEYVGSVVKELQSENDGDYWYYKLAGYGPGPGWNVALSSNEFRHEGWGARPVEAFLKNDVGGNDDGRGLGQSGDVPNIDEGKVDAYKHEHVIEEKLRFADPEIILLMLGTNDIAMQNKDTHDDYKDTYHEAIVSDLDQLIGRIDGWIQSNGGSNLRKIFIATVPPMNYKPDVSDKIANEIEIEFSGDGRVEAVVDMHNAEYNSQTLDQNFGGDNGNNEWHFNATGYQIIGHTWYDALIQYFESY
jgi:lysophospholipase L1-like esterase